MPPPTQRADRGRTADAAGQRRKQLPPLPQARARAPPGQLKAARTYSDRLSSLYSARKTMSFYGLICKPGTTTPFVPNADGSKLHISQVRRHVLSRRYSPGREGRRQVDRSRNSLSSAPMGIKGGGRWSHSETHTVTMRNRVLSLHLRRRPSRLPTNQAQGLS